MREFRVLIVGAGLGGLTLAHSLRNARIDVELFERDKSPWDRPQGYRLHLDADALNAAHEVLSPELRAVVDVTSHRTEPFTTDPSTVCHVCTRHRSSNATKMQTLMMFVPWVHVL